MVVILKCMYIIIVLYFDVCMISFAGVTFSVSLWLQWGSTESKMEVTCAKSHVLRVCHMGIVRSTDFRVFKETVLLAEQVTVTLSFQSHSSFISANQFLSSSQPTPPTPTPHPAPSSPSPSPFHRGVSTWSGSAGGGRVSTSSLPACHQCRGAGSSLVREIELSGF